jgi:hypothetical protein
MPDKIIVTNCSALKQKYGAQGLREVLAAVRTLIASDKKKGLVTQLMDLSDSSAMKRVKGAPVSDPTDERQNKDGVDAISAATKPDYLLILDAPDIVPHIALNNPTPRDKDRNVPSDLPYASDARFTTRDPARYAAVTRVVGRLPGLQGAKKPDFVVKQLDAVAKFKSLIRDRYLSTFAISAEVWKKSTAESVQNIFGTNSIKICPPTGPRDSKLLKPLAHFINCHGAEVDPKFYGQRGDRYPVSMTSEGVAKGSKPSTVVAAECCFGAQLYDPTQANGVWPIANAYFGAGAVAFLGSTNTAYGLEAGNSAADLITQYFLIKILEEASLGRAFLEARQKFVQGQKMEDPVNLKTLAQFILLGDPSLQPCWTDGTKAESNHIDDDAARKGRRIALVAFGKAAADSSGFPGRRITRPARRLHNLVRTIARRRGFRHAPEDIEAFNIVGGEDYQSAMKARDAQQQVFVVTEHREALGKKDKDRPKGVPHIRILVAHAQDDRVVDVTEYVRR